MVLRDWIQEKSKLLDFKELTYLVKNVFGIEVINLNDDLKICAQKCLNVCLNRRIAGEPLSKIIKLKPFYNDYFITNEYTLDPRPETENLIQRIIGKPRSILELGVGTGCLILSILRKFQKAKGFGIDISNEALEVARENAKILNLHKKISFLKNDWANGLKGTYDLIICNPPYINENFSLSKETLSDPYISLFGNIKTYEKILQSLVDLKFYQLLLEVPEGLLNKVKTLIFNRYSKQAKTEKIYNTNIYSVSLEMSENI